MIGPAFRVQQKQEKWLCHGLGKTQNGFMRFNSSLFYISSLHFILIAEDSYTCLLTLRKKSYKFFFFYVFLRYDTQHIKLLSNSILCFEKRNKLTLGGEGGCWCCSSDLISVNRYRCSALWHFWEDDCNYLLWSYDSCGFCHGIILNGKVLTVGMQSNKNILTSTWVSFAVEL